MTKWMALFILAACLQVSARGYSQNNITLSEHDIPLDNLFRKIEQQTKYYFIYVDEWLQKTKKINIEVKNASIEQVLQLCFKDQPLIYSIVGKNIVVKEKESPPGNKNYGTPVPEFDLSGTVTDENEQPLAGANVIVKGTKSGTTSDIYGNFTLKNIAVKGAITISYTGYESKELRYDGISSLGRVTLKQVISELDETIIVAYGTTTARKSTGDISTITATDIAKQPASDILQALQGRLAGLVVKPTSGFFSGNYSVKIRGTNTIPLNGVNATSDPLYVIDGIPLNTNSSNQGNGGGGDPLGLGINQNGLVGPAQGQNPLLYLNPSDIESISVLKDADATAIYGSRGANGVILITTKKAKPGKAQVDVNVFTGYSQQSTKLKLMNTKQYLAMRHEALLNDGLIPDAQNAYDIVVWDTTRNVNWQKELLRTAKTTDGQLGVSGGDTKTSFRLNGGYHQETSPFLGDFSERRISNLLNISHSELDQKLKTTLIINYSNSYSNLPQTDPTTMILEAPNAPAIYAADGKLNYAGWQPAYFPRNFAALQKPYKASTNTFSSNIVVDYNFFKGLSFNISGGYSLTNQVQVALTPGSSQDPLGVITRTAQFGQNKFKTWLLEPTIRWSLQFKNSALQTLVGATYQESIIDGNRITFSGFTNDKQLEDRSAASAYYDSYSNYSQTKIQSLFARINYNLLRRYIINVNLRRDGSSRFGPGNQFGNFGSAGAAWIFSEEPFIKELAPFMSFGKLSGSYGTTGGDQIGDYAYLSTYVSGYNPYQGNPVLSLNNAYNPNYKWTVNKKLDLSLSLGFLKDRILLTSTYFRNRTGNQLANYNLPTLTGFASVIDNLPALVQNKGFEFQLVTKNIQGKKLNWNTSANIGFTINKLLAFPGLDGSTYAYLLTIGQPIARTALFHYLGMNKQNGEYLFQDKNKDGVIDYSVDQDFYQTDPSFTGGVENNIQYGNLALSFFFTFTKQKGFVNTYNYIPGALEANQLLTVQDHWQKPGDIAKFTRYTTYGGNDISLYATSDALWADASYVRLQDVSISYNLPASFWGGAYSPNTRISLQGQNLLTFTGYKGADPSNPGTSVTLPSRRFLTARIQLTF